MIFRSRFARYSPASAATLFILSACSFEPVPSNPVSEGAGALTSSAPAPDVGTNSDRVATNPGVAAAGDRAVTSGNGAAPAGDGATTPDDALATVSDAVDPALASRASSVRPVLERRRDSSDEVMNDRENRPGTDGDDDPEDHDEASVAGHSDGNGADENGADRDAAEEDDGPQLSARETMLAWLADDSVVAGFPAPTARTGAGGSVARIVVPDEPFEFVKPEAVKGIYVNAWAAGSSARSQGLIDLASRTEVNALVIDIKDASGYVSYPTEVMTAREAGADQEIRIRDLVGLLERIHEAGLYPIARIVIVKDPLLIRARPDWAVQDTAGGVWVDSKGLVWANLHDQRVWDYHIELAKEAAAAGFPEIQWDYVRFADAPQEDLGRAVYPGAEGQLRREAVGAFLEYARAELEPFGVDMTIDVFGATTTAATDIGIGQLWEYFIGSVDAALPMVYPSHYWAGNFGIQDPNGHPYEIVRAALLSGLARSEAVEGAGVTRPWLQDFSLGEPLYEAPEVRAQIQATYDAGIAEWVLWNPSSRYTEGALEPVDGFPSGRDPLMRVGGRIVPASERYVAMRAGAEERRMARASARAAAADSSAAETADQEAAGGVRR